MRLSLSPTMLRSRGSPPPSTEPTAAEVKKATSTVGKLRLRCLLHEARAKATDPLLNLSHVDMALLKLGGPPQHWSSSLL